MQEAFGGRGVEAASRVESVAPDGIESWRIGENVTSRVCSADRLRFLSRQARNPGKFRIAFSDFLSGLGILLKSLFVDLLDIEVDSWSSFSRLGPRSLSVKRQLAAAHDKLKEERQRPKVRILEAESPCLPSFLRFHITYLVRVPSISRRYALIHPEILKRVHG